MTAILVSGGAGYVGSHIAKALRNAGYDPVVFDNLSTGRPHFVKWGPLVEADIKDAVAVADVVRRYDIQAVVHCAADADAGQSSAFPQRCYETNVAGTLSLLKGMLDAACTKLVFSSSCAIYGDQHLMPIREDTPAVPISPYGASKLMGERMLSDFQRARAFDFIALRFFNAAGADPDCEIGELRDPETHLIPRQ